MFVLFVCLVGVDAEVKAGFDGFGSFKTLTFLLLEPFLLPHIFHTSIHPAALFSLYLSEYGIQFPNIIQNRQLIPIVTIPINIFSLLQYCRYLL